MSTCSSAESDDLRILRDKASNPSDLELGQIITLGSHLPSNTKRSKSYFDRKIIKVKSQLLRADPLDSYF